MNASLDALRGQGRTILVIDDDPAIRQVLRRLLTRCDFRILEAEEAQEAFQVVADHPDSIDLVICDLVLPGLDGRDAGNVLQARCPGTPILYTSGYSSHSSGRREVRQAGDPFLAKPFDVPELMDAVAGALRA